MTVETSITAKPGRAFLLKVADGEEPPGYVTVGGLRNVTLTLNNNPVDVTNAASGGFREYLPDGGVQSATVSGDGIFDSETEGADLLFAAARGRTLIEAQVVSGHGDSFTGGFAVVSFQRAGALEGAETFTVQLESHGPVVYAPAA